MKEYAKRPSNVIYHICECGHVSFQHEIDADIGNYNECEKCMCPKYNKEKELPREKYLEWFMLEREKELKSND